MGKVPLCFGQGCLCPRLRSLAVSGLMGDCVQKIAPNRIRTRKYVYFGLPAYDEQCTQELVLLRHFQRILLVWIVFHIYRQLLSGPKVVHHPSSFFCVEEMIDVDIYAFERL